MKFPILQLSRVFPRRPTLSASRCQCCQISGCISVKLYPQVGVSVAKSQGASQLFNLSHLQNTCKMQRNQSDLPILYNYHACLQDFQLYLQAAFSVGKSQGASQLFNAIQSISPTQYMQNSTELDRLIVQSFAYRAIVQSQRDVTLNADLKPKHVSA